MCCQAAACVVQLRVLASKRCAWLRTDKCNGLLQFAGTLGLCCLPQVCKLWLPAGSTHSPGQQRPLSRQQLRVWPLHMQGWLCCPVRGQVCSAMHAQWSGKEAAGRGGCARPGLRHASAWPSCTFWICKASGPGQETLEPFLSQYLQGFGCACARTIPPMMLGAIGGTPLAARPAPCGFPVRGAPLRVYAISAPPRPTDFDRAEEARLKGSDAFAELVALNQPKQAVNRPQKARMALGQNGRCSTLLASASAVSASGKLSYQVGVAQGELHFRQTPTFEDCFPASEKCYTTVLHDGLVLRVRAFIHISFAVTCQAVSVRQRRPLASWCCILVLHSGDPCAVVPCSAWFLQLDVIGYGVLPLSVWRVTTPLVWLQIST